jgi:hypothetical protein
MNTDKHGFQISERDLQVASPGFGIAALKRAEARAPVAADVFHPCLSVSIRGLNFVTVN